MIVIGSTSQSVEILALDFDGKPVTTLTFATAGLTFSYSRPGASAAVSIAPVTLATVTTPWTAGGFIHKANGVYRLDVPNAATASGATEFTVSGTATSYVFRPVTVPLVTATVAVGSIDADAIDADALSDAAIEKLLDEFWQRPDLHDGTCQAGSTTTAIVLGENASAEDDHYNGVYLLTTGGTGADQRAIIVDYDGESQTATIDRTWSVAPDATTTYTFDGLAASDLDEEAIRDAIGLDEADLGDRLDAIPGLTWDEARSDHDDAGTFGESLQIEDGTCQAGSTETTIVLASTASEEDDFYNGQEAFVVAGTGAGQSARIVDYDGDSRTATIVTEEGPWAITPDATSKYRLGGIAAGGEVASVAAGVTLASGAITAGSIASFAITADKIASDAITAAKIAADAITAAKFGSIAIDPNGEFLEKLAALIATQIPPTGGSVTIPSDGNGSLVVRGTGGSTLFTQAVTRDPDANETIGPAS